MTRPSRSQLAVNAERALSQPIGRAAREREAETLARGAVRFVTEPAGPGFSTYEEALAAYPGRIDEGRSTIQPEDRYCALREVMATPPPRSGGKARPRTSRAAKPVYKDGRRWSLAGDSPPTVWRLSVSYWRIIADEELEALEQARLVRRRASDLDPAALRALAQQPLLPTKPQKALDVGLFETPLPEAPHILIADE